MKKETIKVFFSLFLLVTLLLSNHQTLANEMDTGTPVAKIASTTLHIHDEAEDYKLLHNKMPDTRKRRSFLQTCV